MCRCLNTSLLATTLWGRIWQLGCSLITPQWCCSTCHVVMNGSLPPEHVLHMSGSEARMTDLRALGGWRDGGWTEENQGEVGSSMQEAAVAQDRQTDRSSAETAKSSWRLCSLNRPPKSLEYVLWILESVRKITCERAACGLPQQSELPLTVCFFFCHY